MLQINHSHPDIVLPYILSTFYPYFEISKKCRTFSSAYKAPNLAMLNSKIIGMDLLEDLFMCCSLRSESLDLLIGDCDTEKRGLLDDFEPLTNKENEIEDGPLNSKYSIIDLVLLKVARNHLNLRRDVTTALFFYKKGGFLHELLYDVCTVLTSSFHELETDNELYQYWVKEVGMKVLYEVESDYWMKRSRRGDGSLLDQNMREVFDVVIKIFNFFDISRSEKDDGNAAYRALEEFSILPSSPLSIPSCITKWMSDGLSSPTTRHAWILIEVLLVRALNYIEHRVQLLEAIYSFGQNLSGSTEVRRDLEEKRQALVIFSHNITRNRGLQE